MLLSARIWLLLLAGICCCRSALAQLPFYTDNPEVTDLGTLHFEFFDEFDGLQSSQFPNLRQNTANFKVNYGLPHRLELDVDVPYLSIYRAVGINNATGPGDLDMVVKWNFRAVSQGSHHPALAASFYIEFPTGNEREHLGSGLTDYWLNFIAEEPFTEHSRLNVNLGFLFAGNTSTGAIGIQTTRGHVFTGGISLLHDFNPRLTLGGEVYGGVADNDQLGRSQLQGMLGGIYTIHERFAITFAVLGGRYEASPRIGGQIGFTADIPGIFHSPASKKFSAGTSGADLQPQPIVQRTFQ